MKKKRITVQMTVEVDEEDLKVLHVYQIRYLLADALAEFRHPRNNPDDQYVDLEVFMRYKVAEIFRQAALRMDPIVEDVDGDD